MRRLSLFTLAAASLAAGLTIAEVAPPATPGADPAPAAEGQAPAAEAAAEPDISTKATTHETIASGSVPALAGRWLVLNDLDLSGGLRVVPAFWEVSDQDGKPEIVERFVALPLEMTNALEQKNAAGEKWEPTAADLDAIRAGWADLPDQMRGVAMVRNELWGADAFIDEIKQEPATKDARWVLRQTYQFVPGGNRPVRQVNIFGVLDETPQGFAGDYSGAAVAVAPFPIPIPFQGSFRLIRLDEAPARGFLARLAEMFSGCGR